MELWSWTGGVGGLMGWRVDGYVVLWGVCLVCAVYLMFHVLATYKVMSG